MLSDIELGCNKERRKKIMITLIIRIKWGKKMKTKFHDRRRERRKRNTVFMNVNTVPK